MKKKLLFLVAWMTLLGCEMQEPSVQDFPIIRTLSPTVDETGALFRAEIVQKGTNPISKLGFVWDTTTPDINTSDTIMLSDFSDLGSFSIKVENGLSSGIGYVLRAFAIQESEVIYGNTIRFESQGSSNSSWSFVGNTRGIEGSFGTPFGNNIGSTGYLSFGNSDFYSFDPVENRFTQLNGYPTSGNTGTWHASVKQNDALYYFSNENERFYKYQNNLWTLQDELPFRTGSWNGYYHGHSTTENLYILSSRVSYQYNPQSESWTPKQTIPSNGSPSIAGTSLGDKAYVITLDRNIWEYDIEADNWVLKTTFPGRLGRGIVSFTLNDKIYFGLTSTFDRVLIWGTEVWSFDPVEEVWAREESLPTRQENNQRFYFSINDQLYLGHGLGNSSYDIWKFSPL